MVRQRAPSRTAGLAVCITGGGARIGAELFRELAASGATLLVVGTVDLMTDVDLLAAQIVQAIQAIGPMDSSM